MSWRCCKDTDSRNKINCQIIFRIFKRSKNTSSFSPAIKMAPSAAGEFAFVLLVSGCGQRPGVAPVTKRGLSRAGLASSGVGMGAGCPWGPVGGGTSLLPQRSHWWSLMPPAQGGVAHKPSATTELSLVALPVVTPMVALPSPFLPWWHHHQRMLSSVPSHP